MSMSEREKIRKEQELRWASETGDLEEVKRLVGLGVDPQCGDSKRGTPLHYASWRGRLSIVQYLVQEVKVDMNVADDDGRTPLRISFREGYLDVVNFLLSLNSDVSGTDSKGWSVLHWACHQGWLEVVKFLTSANKVDPNLKATDGHTPLHIASQEGYLDVVNFLLTLNSDVSGTDSKGWCVLHWACQHGWLELVKFLTSEKKVDPNLKLTDGRTPLHIASQEGYLDVVNFLLTLNSDVSGTDSNGWSVLHWACHQGWLEVVKFLTSANKVDPNLKATDGHTPLHIASQEGHLDVVNFLLTLDGDVSGTDSKGWSVLHWACHQGWLEVVKFFTSAKKVDPNLKATDGDTPLHIASQEGHLDVVNFLLTLDGDVSGTDSKGWSVLHWACHQGWLEVVKFFTSAKKVDPNLKATDGHTPLHIASQEGHLDVVNFLLTLDGDVSGTDSNGWSVLHWACQHGWLELIKFLTSENKVDPNLKLTDGRTPLHIASQLEVVFDSIIMTATNTMIHPSVLASSLPWYGRLEVVKFLTEGKADAGVKTDDGLTPLHLAAQYGQLDTVRYLVSDLKCDSKVTDGKGKTPLNLASNDYTWHGETEHEREQVVEYLKGLADKPPALDRDYTACFYTASSPSVRNERVALYTVCRSNSLSNMREFLKRKLREKLPDSVIDQTTEIEVTFSSPCTSTIVLPEPTGWTLSYPEISPTVQNPLQISKSEADSVESPTIMLTMTLQEENEAEPEEEIALQLQGFSLEHELLWKLFSQEELDKRRQELLSAFTNAMGKVHKMRFAHLLFFGLPGAGKSTLIKCLMGKIVDYAKRMKSGDQATNPSTGVCDKPIPAVIDAKLDDYAAHAMAIQTGTQSGTQTGTWRHLRETLDEMFQLLSNLCQPKTEVVDENGTRKDDGMEKGDGIKRGDGMKKGDSMKKGDDMRRNYLKPTNPRPSIMNGGEKKQPLIPKSASVDSPTFSVKGESLRPPALHQVEKHEELRRMVDDAVSMKKLIQAEKYIDRTWTVYLTDTGGQLEFQEFFTVLGHGPSLYILLFRLDQPLNEKFTITYRRKNGTKFEYESQLTVKEILQQSLASIDCLGKNVKVLILSTHKDLVPNPHAKMCEIDTELRKSPLVTRLVLSHPCKHGDCAKQGITHTVIAVNNYCMMEGGTEHDIMHIRQVIERYISRYLPEISRPASWFFFGMAVRNQKSRVLSYEYCESLATKCGIKSGKEFEDVLCFLHNEIGLIRHFKDVTEMKDIIVQDPQAIFDKITTLVTETFGSPEALTDSTRIERKRGLFSLKDVASECSAIASKGDELLTPEKLVGLLQHLRIITPLKKGPKHTEEEEVPLRYFMPCVMYHSEETTDSEAPCEMQKAPGIPPLLFTFDCGYTPKGMFGALVTHIEAEESDWCLELKETFKNKVYFTVGRDMVSLKHTSTHLEVTLYVSDGDDDDCTQQCTEIYKLIEDGLEKVAQKLQYINIKPIPAFYCCGKHTPSISLHLAKKEQDSKGTFFRCVLNHRVILKCSAIEGCERWWSDAEKASPHGVCNPPIGPTGQDSPQKSYGQTSETPVEQPDSPLNTTEHYQDVRRALLKVKPQWRNIGLALGFPLFKLNEFTGSIGEKMDKMIEVWLNHTYSTPTWGALMNALEDSTVEGGKPVAAEIAAKICPGQPVRQASLSVLNPANLPNWSVDDVCQWLNEQGMGKYVDIFRENDVNGQCLLTLDTDIMKEDLGITVLGHRSKILKVIKSQS